MALKLFLLRHGATGGDGARRYKGTIDVPLCHEGMEQMEKTASFLMERLEGRGLDAVYTSGLSRAIKSAEIVAAPHGLRPIVVPELRERHFGRWEGMSFDEIGREYPAEFARWVKDPLRFSPVSGESTLEVRRRALNALDSILGPHKEGAVAAVAHGGINRVLLCHLLDIPLQRIFSIEQDLAAVNIIEFGDDGNTVVKLVNGGCCQP
jgi:alpha-ribazole phosphatase/probable phosphoglycerate mutase